MMQRLLTKYGLALHIACICLFPLCFLGQSRVFGFVPLFWLSLIAIEWAILLPSICRGETLADARQRVSRAFWRDPFLYVGVAVIGLVGAQSVNSGCELSYLPDTDVWQLSSPPFPWAMFSVEQGVALAQLAVFAACLTAGLILRVAVGKMAKRVFLQVLSGISGAFALVCIEASRRGDEPWVSLVSGAETSGAGFYFGFWLLVGMGLSADAFVERKRAQVLLFAVCILGNLLGLLWFASPLTIAICVCAAIVLFIYWLAYLSKLVSKAAQFSLFLCTVVSVSAIVLGVTLFSPNPISIKMGDAWPMTEYWNEMSVRNDVRVKAAMEIWEIYPWAGVGADGFYHTVGLTVEPDEWTAIEKDRAYVYNDGVQFLCEYGVVGTGVLLTALIILWWPVCCRMRLVWETRNQSHLSPIVVSGILATMLCCLESFTASPFRSAAVMLSWVCVLASIPAFLPEKVAKESS